VVQVEDLTCRPCSVFGDKTCYRGDWACLQEIDIQKIVDKI
ncbi:glycosyl transferase, partial [Microbacterium sp. ZXX196]|nr:glycosyl transferase [Microbacterium sp. ZXX196]